MKNIAKKTLFSLLFFFGFLILIFIVFIAYRSISLGISPVKIFEPVPIDQQVQRIGTEIEVEPRELQSVAAQPCGLNNGGNYSDIDIAIAEAAGACTLRVDNDPELTTLPDDISKLFRLYHLQISNTGLNTLPDGIGDLKTLSVLYLANNKLTSLPDSIAALSEHLELLVISGNPMSEAEVEKVKRLLPNTQIIAPAF